MGEETEEEKRLAAMSGIDREIYDLTVRGGKLIRKISRRQNLRRAGNLKARLDAIKARIVELAKQGESNVSV